MSINNIKQKLQARENYIKKSERAKSGAPQEVFSTTFPKGEIFGAKVAFEVRHIFYLKERIADRE